MQQRAALAIVSAIIYGWALVSLGWLFVPASSLVGALVGYVVGWGIHAGDDDEGRRESALLAAFAGAIPVLNVALAWHGLHRAVIESLKPAPPKKKPKPPEPPPTEPGKIQ
jgi:hypothetical protein